MWPIVMPLRLGPYAGQEPQLSCIDRRVCGEVTGLELAVFAGVIG